MSDCLHSCVAVPGEGRFSPVSSALDLMEISAALTSTPDFKASGGRQHTAAPAAASLTPAFEVLTALSANNPTTLSLGSCLMSGHAEKEGKKCQNG